MQRSAVLDALSEWLAAGQAAERLFLITGAPGTGKSVVARTLHASARVAFDAAHFCDRNEIATITPLHFVENLSAQLSQDVEFAAVLQERIKQHREIHIHAQVTQHIGALHGKAEGIHIALGDISPEVAFVEVIQKPLAELAQRHPARRWLLLIDGLDEARSFGSKNIGSLLEGSKGLPAQVRVVATSRPDEAAERRLSAVGRRVYRLDVDYPSHKREREITRMVRRELLLSRAVRQRLAPELSTASCARLIAKAANTNFLCAALMVPMLENTPGLITEAVLEQFPSDLGGIYLQYLDRLCSEPTLWADQYRPILGLLSVTQTPLTEAELVAIGGVSKEDARVRLASLRQLLTPVPGGAETRWQIYHRSFAEFLLSDQQADTYWCEETSQHRRFLKYWQGGHASWASVDWPAASQSATRYLLAHALGANAEVAELRDMLSAPYFREKLAREGSSGVIADLRGLVEAEASRPRLELLPQLVWLCPLLREKLAQEIAPPVVPIYVKLGMTERAQKLARELDSTSDQYYDEARSAQDKLVEALASLGKLAEAEAIMMTAPDDRRQGMAEALVRGAVEHAPADVPSLLERHPLRGTLSGKTYGALAKLSQSVNLQLTDFAPSPEGKVQLVRALKGLEPRRALDVARSLGNNEFYEDVGGFRAYQGQKSAIAEVAVAASAKEPAWAWSLLGEIAGSWEACIAAVLMAESLPPDSAAFGECQELLRPLRLLSQIPHATLAARGRTWSLPPTRPDTGDRTELTACIHTVARLDLGALCSDATAHAVMLALGKRVAGLLARASVDYEASVTELMTQWLATFDLAEALQFGRWAAEHWSSTSAGMSVKPGVAAGVATGGVDAVINFFKGHQEFQHHLATQAAFDVLRRRGFEEAFRLIESVEPRYSATRAVLIGALAEDTSDEPSLRRLLGLLPSFTQSQVFELALQDAQEALRVAQPENGQVPESEFLRNLAGSPAKAEAAALKLDKPGSVAACLLELEPFCVSASDKRRILTRAWDEIDGGVPEKSSLHAGFRPRDLQADLALRMARLDAPTAMQWAARQLDHDCLFDIVSAWWRAQGASPFLERVERLREMFATRQSAVRATALSVVCLLARANEDDLLELDAFTLEHDEYSWRLIQDVRAMLSGTFTLELEEDSGYSVRYYEIAHCLALVSRAEPLLAATLLNGPFCAWEFWTERLERLEIVLACIARVDPELAESSWAAVCAGDTLGYGRACGLRGIALGRATKDWAGAAAVIARIEDQWVQASALDACLQARLQHDAAPLTPDELRASVRLADKQYDSGRTDVLTTLFVHGRAYQGWNDASIAALLGVVAMGNRTAALRLLPSMLQFLAATRARLLEGFELESSVKLLA